MTSFNDCVQLHRERVSTLRRIGFELMLPSGAVSLQRPPPRYPYVPNDPATLDERCNEVYSIQVQGLARRKRPEGRFGRVAFTTHESKSLGTTRSVSPSISSAEMESSDSPGDAHDPA
jgi:hypothetical protein